MTNKRLTTIGVTAGVLAGLGIGAVMGVPGLSGAASPAQEDTTTTDDTTTDDTTTDDTTTDETDAERDAEHQARLRENLQGLVDEGTLTTEQADRVAEYMVENRPERGRDGLGGMHGGRHGRGGPGGIWADGEVAEFLGLTQAELREALAGGATLESLLPEGATVDQLVAIMVDDLEEHLADGVEDGRLTQEEADAKLAEATERITDRINGVDD
ncbi:MAG: hypothetical protein MUE78_11280 [Ilumatobacteraceae bacterium]|nr:hypothetical protein [Ilumatobacteraceae bacterium]